MQTIRTRIETALFEIDPEDYKEVEVIMPNNAKTLTGVRIHVLAAKTSGLQGEVVLSKDDENASFINEYVYAKDSGNDLKRGFFETPINMRLKEEARIKIRAENFGYSPLKLAVLFLWRE